jgi:predicted Zn-dependent protease
MAPMLESFRTLSASQSAAIRPRFVRVVTVGPRDTIASLSARMAYPDYRVERFRVLNRLSGNTPPAAGTRVKIVTY